MARISKAKMQISLRNHTIVGGAEHQKKEAQLQHLRHRFSERKDNYIGEILEGTDKCGVHKRCNSRYCPTCSNPRTSTTKRRSNANSAKRSKKVCLTTKHARSGEYRVNAGQRMTGAFVGISNCMCHCVTINLGLVAVEGNLTETLQRYRRLLRKFMNRLNPGAIARGKFDITLKYADELAFGLQDHDLPNGVTNSSLPHERMAMLHIHFAIFDPLMTRREIRERLVEEFPGSKRVCVKRTKYLQGYLEYSSMEKVETSFGHESCDAVLDFVTIDATWTRHNRNFSFGKSIAHSGVSIDPERVAVLEREYNLAWVKKNWSKLDYAQRFIHVWLSGAEMILAGARSLPDYPNQFHHSFNHIYSLLCNWLRGDFFEVIDFKEFLSSLKTELRKTGHILPQAKQLKHIGLKIG